MVAFGWEQRRRPRPADTAMLSAIAHQCALAIDRTRLMEAERAERDTLEFLAGATRLMVSALDPNEVVKRLVQLAVPRLAPWCAVYVNERDRLERVAIEVAGHGTLADQLRRSNPIAVGSDSPVAIAYRSGRVQVVPSVTRDMVARVYEPGLAEQVLSLDGETWSALAVPVYASGRVIGVMSLVSNAWAGSPPDDVRLAAEGLAGRAGMALANARRFESEHRIARLLAEALMPAHVPAVPGFSAAVRYLPTEGPVAGDWYDVSRLPNGEFLIGVGDAAGHGVTATSLMALLRSAAQGLAVAGNGPGAIVEGLNKLVAEHDEESFATALYACLDTDSGVFEWSSAGHVPPLMFHAGQAWYLSSAPGPPLGLPDTGAMDTRRLTVAPGHGLVLVTDGVVERRGSNLRLGMQRLASAVETRSSNSAQQIADHIVNELCQTREDDCCIVVLTRNLDPVL
jgi:serine/threonine-protein kinase RsbW